MHDPLNSYDLVLDELAQLRETGHDVDVFARRLEGIGHDDTDALEALFAELGSARKSQSWGYEEPDGIEAILEALTCTTKVSRVSEADIRERVLGGWLGRIAGCNLGKPVEWGPHWTSGHIREYLVMMDSWPLRDYFPVPDPMPTGYEFRENWPETTRGRVNGSARDDDIDYPILGLHLLETHGRQLSTRNVADAWLTLFPYLQVYTAERAAYTNLLARVPLEDVAATRNPYREWIGALIRGDVFGWVNPGDPIAAMRLAHEDAVLSHVANGVYGELWSAALLSCAFTAATVAEAFDASLQFVPPGSRLAEALRDVRGLYAAHASWDEALSQVQQRYGHYSWVHTINNAAVIAAGLLWGENDYAATVGLTVSGGWDTDSNGATAGSVAGVVLGARGLPEHFTTPLRDRTRSALFGFDKSRISDLAERTVAIALAGARAT